MAVSAHIPPGASVIVKGNERVFPGQPVIDPSRPATAPAAPGGTGPTGGAPHDKPADTPAPGGGH